MPDDTQQNNQLQDDQTSSQIGQADGQGQEVDMFPSFLNDPASSQGDFDPSQMSGVPEDGMEENQDAQNKMQIAGGGTFSPEISGGASSTEAQPKAVEYGTEIQPSVEVPEIEQVENKERKPQQDKPEVPEKPTIIEKPKETPPDHKAPGLFGYVVSPKVMQDFKAIKTTKTKGAPDSTKTWLYVLLDRLLKMHSQKSE